MKKSKKIILGVIGGTVAALISMKIINSSDEINDIAVALYGVQPSYATYNNQFLGYEGVQKGSQITSLLNQIIINNTSHQHDDYMTIDVFITFSNGSTMEAIFTDGSTNISTNTHELNSIRKAISTNYNYDVAFETDDDYGYINKVIIKQMSK